MSESCESSAFVWHSDIFWSLIRNVPGCCLYLQFHGVLCYNVWVTQLGDRDGRVTSLPWPSPSASGVSMCHSPWLWQTKTWPLMRPILIIKILLVFMRNVSVYYLLRWYSSFLIIICMFDFYWIIHHFLILHYIIILLVECNINYL